MLPANEHSQPDSSNLTSYASNLGNMEEAPNNSDHIPFGGNVTPILKESHLSSTQLKPLVPPPNNSSRIRFSISPSPNPSLSPGLVKTFQPQILTKPVKTLNTSDSGEEFKDPRNLLAKYRTESQLLSEIHNKSAEYCSSRNQFCTLFALTISLVCSVVDPILQRYAEDVQKIFTTVSFAFIGGINVMFNFLAYQQKSELHKQARDSHRQIVEMVEVTFAYSNSDESINYDFNKVLNEIRQIHTNLTKISPPIPSPIALKYDKILCPSLLKRELKDLKKKEEVEKRSVAVANHRIPSDSNL